MQRSNSPPLDPSASDRFPPTGAVVPVAPRVGKRPALLTPAVRKALRNRMLFFRQASLGQIQHLSGASEADLRRFRRDLTESRIPDILLQRGAGLPFTRELPQGALLYLLVRALRPRRVVETGVRPGYSTAWLLAGLDANGTGELVSLGPGPTVGRASGVNDVTVGQFVAPAQRGRDELAHRHVVHPRGAADRRTRAERDQLARPVRVQPGEEPRGGVAGPHPRLHDPAGPERPDEQVEERPLRELAGERQPRAPLEEDVGDAALREVAAEPLEVRLGRSRQVLDLFEGSLAEEEHPVPERLPHGGRQ